MSASETERRYIWGCSCDEGPLDYDQTISALIGVPPPLLSNPLSQSTSLSRWHFGKSHCHTTFNKDKSPRRAAGDDWPDRAGASLQCIPHISSLAHPVFHWVRPAKWVQNTAIYVRRWHERTSTHRHISHVEVCQFLSLSLPPWIWCLYTFNISSDCQTAASSVLSAEPG